MEPQKEQIAPEIIRAIIAKATARGVSVNDYLAELLGLENGHEEESSLTARNGEPGARALTPYELVEDIIGSIDSSIPDPAPDAQPRHTAFGAYLVEKHNKEIKRSSALSRIAAQQGMTPGDWVRQNFPDGCDSQGRRLSEVLDTSILEEESKLDGID